MIWTIVVGGSGLILLWQFLKPQPQPICGVYKQPGEFNYILFFLAYLAKGHVSF